MFRVVAAAVIVATALCGVAAASPTLTPAAPTVPAGAPLIFTVANDLTPNARDWLGLYQTSAPDDAYLAWQFMNGMKIAPSTGLSGATLQFPAPTVPGTYEIRLFSNNTYSRLATSSTVTVPAPTITPGALTVPAGTSIGFVVAGGPANATDWLGLYRASAADDGYLTWQFMNGMKTAPMARMSGATLQFPAPTVPGIYEIRLFNNNTYSRLATSGTVTVTGVITSVTPIATTVSAGTSIGFVVAGARPIRPTGLACTARRRPTTGT